MRQHPRTSTVQKARNKFDEFLLDLEQEHQLTCAEIFSLLGAATIHYAESLTQIERHPHNPDKSRDTSATTARRAARKAAPRRGHP
jgi:hypothetical protein